MWAFVPHPLPPEFAYSPDLVGLLSEADAALGRLAGIGERLPNPHLLIYPYVRREAVLSSRIEGTQSTLSQLLLFEVDQQEASGPDVHEVSNYVLALEEGLARLDKLPLSLRLVRQLHSRLMYGVRGSERAGGSFRRHQNYVAPAGAPITEATYIPPPVPEMNEALQAWEKFLHLRRGVPVLIQCAMLHYQFEAIHPFDDGNGRVGRLLITLFLCERNRLRQPLLYLSAFFERYRTEYYDRLLAVSRDGDWAGWISLFLRGVASQARAGAKHADHILDLHASYRQRLREARATPPTQATLDGLFKNPYITARAVAEMTHTTPPTAQNIIDRLIKAGIVEEITGQKWGRVYCAQELLKALAEPPPGAE